MPKIPIYSPNVPTPWPPEPPSTALSAADIASAGLPGEALAQAGLSLTKTSAYLAKFASQLHEAKQVEEYSEAKLKMRENMLNLRAELEAHPNYEEIPGIFEQKSQEIYQNMLNSSADRDVQTHLKLVWANFYPEQKLAVTRLSRQKMILSMAGNLQNQYSRSVKLAASAKTPEESDKIKADFLATLGMMKSLGVVNAKEADIMAEKYDKAVTIERVGQLILKDPVAALELLKSGKISGLDAQDITTLENRALVAIHHNQEENALQLAKKLEDGTLTLDDIRQFRNQKLISLPQADYFERLLKLPGDKQDDWVALNLQDRILNMKPGDKEEFQKIKDAIMSENTPLKATTRHAYLSSLYSKFEKGEKAEQTQERVLLNDIKDQFIDPFSYIMIRRQYEEEKRAHPDWTWEQKKEVLMRIVEPYMEEMVKKFPKILKHKVGKKKESTSTQPYWLNPGINPGNYPRNLQRDNSW